jgi:hypothetical protein
LSGFPRLTFSMASAISFFQASCTAKTYHGALSSLPVCDFLSIMLITK